MNRIRIAVYAVVLGSLLLPCTLVAAGGGPCGTWCEPVGPPGDPFFTTCVWSGDPYTRCTEYYTCIPDPEYGWICGWICYETSQGCIVV